MACYLWRHLTNLIRFDLLNKKNELHLFRTLVYKYSRQYLFSLKGSLETWSVFRFKKYATFSRKLLLRFDDAMIFENLLVSVFYYDNFQLQMILK